MGQKKLVIAGGVSANSLLRRTLAEECKKRDWEMYMPENLFAVTMPPWSVHRDITSFSAEILQEQTSMLLLQ